MNIYEEDEFASAIISALVKGKLFYLKEDKESNFIDRYIHRVVTEKDETYLREVKREAIEFYNSCLTATGFINFNKLKGLPNLLPFIRSLLESISQNYDAKTDNGAGYMHYIEIPPNSEERIFNTSVSNNHLSEELKYSNLFNNGGDNNGN